jgi:hypothetical protein
MAYLKTAHQLDRAIAARSAFWAFLMSLIAKNVKKLLPVYKV